MLCHKEHEHLLHSTQHIIIQKWQEAVMTHSFLVRHNTVSYSENVLLSFSNIFYN
jgi:hypothetical protein